MKNPIGIAALITALEKERPSKTLEVLVSKCFQSMKLIVMPNYLDSVWAQRLEEPPDKPEGPPSLAPSSLPFLPPTHLPLLSRPLISTPSPLSPPLPPPPPPPQSPPLFSSLLRRERLDLSSSYSLLPSSSSSPGRRE